MLTGLIQIDLTEEQLVGHNNATMRGALEGFAAGTGLGMAGSAVLGRYSAGYRALPPSLKALGIIFVAAPAFAIQAERRGIEFDKSQWCVFCVACETVNLNDYDL